MKKHSRFLLPAALVVGALGCSHAKSSSTVPQPIRLGAGITWRDIERSPGTPLEQLLAARVPGITLARAADGRMIMIIRGQSTLSAPQEPLFVVNGVALGLSANF